MAHDLRHRFHVRAMLKGFRGHGMAQAIGRYAPRDARRFSGLMPGMAYAAHRACLMDYLSRRYAPVLAERYKIEVEPEDSGYDLLEKAGRKRGFLMRGAQVDTQRMARVLLDEFRGGKLGRFTLETVEDAQ